MSGGDDHGPGHTDASHLDIMHELGSLGGKMDANFETLFRGQRAVAAELVAVRERLTKVEIRRPGAVASRPAAAMTWKRAGGIAVVIVTILGGISAAYHEGVTILVAIHRALFDAAK